MITTEHTKEDLSRAYVIAAAGRAQCVIRIGDESHDYGLDGHFDSVRLIGNKRKGACCPIHFQLKSTVKWRKVAGMIEYALDVPAYDHLVTLKVEKNANPVILIVLCLPDDETLWASFGHDALSLRECCYYWFPPAQVSKKSSNSHETIRIPETNRLTPDVLRDFLAKRKDGHPIP